MSHNDFQPSDKIERHYRQQLSALIDGELSSEEGRFLLRRLQHDAELAACQERWQLCGDVLRGAACAPAPANFAERVQAALAHEPALAVSATAAAAAGGTARWRWGGGAALAASVAALAMFMARERLPDELPGPATLPAMVVATTAQLPALPSKADAGAVAATVASAPAAAVAATARRSEAAARRVASATRSQQAARSAGARQVQEPVRQAATAAAEQPLLAAVPAPAEAPVSANPFAHPQALQAKPWPRSSLGAGSSPISAGLHGFSAQRSTTFYPFEPRQSVPVLNPPPELLLPQQ